MAPSPGTTLISPGGRPAVVPASASSNADLGASSEGFTMTAFPQARAIATRATNMIVGPFHGRMIPMMPSGCLTV